MLNKTKFLTEANLSKLSELIDFNKERRGVGAGREDGMARRGDLGFPKEDLGLAKESLGCAKEDLGLAKGDLGLA